MDGIKLKAMKDHDREALLFSIIANLLDNQVIMMADGPYGGNAKRLVRNLLNHCKSTTRELESTYNVSQKNVVGELTEYLYRVMTIAIESDSEEFLAVVEAYRDGEIKLMGDNGNLIDLK